VMIVSAGGTGLPTLEAALNQARDEAAVIEHLSDRIVSDLTS
jgi:hypothetical protein